MYLDILITTVSSVYNNNINILYIVTFSQNSVLIVGFLGSILKEITFPLEYVFTELTFFFFFLFHINVFCFLLLSVLLVVAYQHQVNTNLVMLHYILAVHFVCVF